VEEEQKWKQDPSLYDCPRKEGRKEMDYAGVYVDEFLSTDPLRDWESIDRCKVLWDWSMERTEGEIRKVLDCGTKDGQFPEWLVSKGIDAVGVEIAPEYVAWAKERNRPVEYGDVCSLEYQDESFDMVFSHHLLGLVSNWYKGLSEMYRVVRKGGYLVTLNDIPGNKRKHYSYIGRMEEVNNMLLRKEMAGNHVVYKGTNPNGMEPEKIIFLRKAI